MSDLEIKEKCKETCNEEIDRARVIVRKHSPTLFDFTRDFKTLSLEDLSNLLFSAAFQDACAVESKNVPDFLTGFKCAILWAQLLKNRPTF